MTTPASAANERDRQAFEAIAEKYDISIAPVSDFAKAHGATVPYKFAHTMHLFNVFMEGIQAARAIPQPAAEPVRCESCAGSGEVYFEGGGTLCPDCEGSGKDRAPSADSAADGWISVEDRLPDIGTEVIVYCPHRDRRNVTALARFIPYEGSKEYFWDNSYPGKGNLHLSESVTHWQPLPAAPAIAAMPKEAM